ncbi:ABC transporter substrate-binding protein [Kitasatospora camelliae]|uniref:ABC transporter substrate-binding protein n=1 Tax=Kitasatospora camelliae TaxID=3156397 RepID=A0AAU8K2I6_9ACTN
MARRSGPRRTTVAVLTAAALLLPAAAGCGGPADAAGDGTEYTVTTWAPADRPGVTALAEAIGRDLAARGGLNGHRLRVLTCDERDSAEGAAACARQAVDARAVAVIGAFGEHADGVMPVLEAAGIPYLGGYGMSGAEFSSPLSYPVSGGTPALIAGSGRQLVAAGCKQVALVRPDTRAGDTLTRYLSTALRPTGVRLVDVKTPEKDPDFQAVARQALGQDQRGGCVSNALDPERSLKLLDAYRRLAPRNTLLASVAGSVQQSVIESISGGNGALDGALATGWYPPATSKVWDDLRTVAGGDRRIDVSDLGVQTTWVAYQVFLQAADRIHSAGQPLTAKALRAQLDSGDSLDTGGATPPLNWGMTDMLPSAESPRLTNTWVTYQQIKGGRLTEQQSGFVDVRWVLTGGRPPA